jgi:hypothetical protein
LFIRQFSETTLLILTFTKLILILTFTKLKFWKIDNKRFKLMANSQTLQGILNEKDLFYPAPQGGGTTLSDEYKLEANSFGQPLTISLFADDPNIYDTFLEVIDANTGNVLASDDDSGNVTNSLISNSLTTQGGVDYRIRVTSFGPVSPNNDNAYTLQVSIPQGELTVNPLTISPNPNPNPSTVKATEFVENPAQYIKDIRDFDGNDLGAHDSWKSIGSIDVQGDGDTEYVFVNPTIERWATVGADITGTIDFSNHGFGGDTRVVGIYIDPLVESGEVERFSDFDSQRRFQNDLRIDNLTLIPDSGRDYNRDGLQEIYFGVNDGTAVLHAYMHADGNIQYANYQSASDLEQFMIENGVSRDIWGDWL